MTQNSNKETSYKKVLIAIDSSEFSITAAKKGLELARQLKAEAALLYVIDTSKAMGNFEAGITPELAMIVLKKEAEQMLDELVAMSAYKKVIKLMPEGHPAKDIITTSEAWQADLIITGTHGRSGLLNLIAGSVSEYILHHSKIPVLVIPLR